MTIGEIQHQYRPPKKHAGLAITGLVIGVISVLLGWVPIIGALVGVTGLFFSLFGLAGKQSKAMSVAGTVLSSIAIATSIAVSVYVFSNSDALSSPEKPLRQSANPAEDEAAQHSESCLAVAAAASKSQEELYATHPLWDMDRPGSDAPLETLEAFDALMADEEAQWQAIVRPLYENCSSPADLFTTFKQYPDLAGFTRPDAVTSDVIEAWCWDEDKAVFPACVGWKEWVAANPE